MKSITQMSKETGVPYNTIFQIVKREGLVTKKEDGSAKKTLTIHQEDYIHDVLFYSGYFTELILESKMNIPDPVKKTESFEDFKKRTYGKKI